MPARNVPSNENVCSACSQAHLRVTARRLARVPDWAVHEMQPWDSPVLQPFLHSVLFFKAPWGHCYLTARPIWTSGVTQPPLRPTDRRCQCFSEVGVTEAVP